MSSDKYERRSSLNTRGSQADSSSQERLEDVDKLYRLLIESVTDYAIFVLDPTGIIRSWNLGAERLKGYSESEVIGKHFSMFYIDEDLEKAKPPPTRRSLR